MKIKGKFDVGLQPLDASFATSDGASVGRMGINKTFHGDLDATSVGEMLSLTTATKGSAGYVAIESVTGSLLGKTGSFALQHFGTMSASGKRLTLEVIPDSGTEALASLAGVMDIIVRDGEHYYEFDFTLETNLQ